MTIAETTKRMVQENKQLRLKLREEKLVLIQQQKEEQKEEKTKHIVDFVLNNYDITSNNKDKIQSSLLNEAINSNFKALINTQLVKEIILGNFCSITNKKTKGCRYFCGIKPKQ